MDSKNFSDESRGLMCSSSGLVGNVHQVKKPPKKAPLKCNNLLKNPSFEAGLTGWETDNVISSGTNTFEGTQLAQMRTGAASMSQDISLAGLKQSPLFLSFNVYAGNNDENSNGDLVVTILWLDYELHNIGAGLEFFIPTGRINSRARLTYFDVTERPPAEAAWARLLFSKGTVSNNTILVDQVILAPVGTTNLVENSSFEAGLTGWTSTTFVPNFQLSFDGAATAALPTTAQLSTLFQDVPIKHLPAQSSFLFSFAGLTSGFAILDVQVLWLDKNDSIIGTPGLALRLPNAVLLSQSNYLTYLDLTNPAPYGAVKARIMFSTNFVEINSVLRLDKIILAEAASPNLVQNPSFDANLSSWTAVNATALADNDNYEGVFVANVDDGGGLIFQDIPLPCGAGHCFLLNFALGYEAGVTPPFYGNMLVKVLWLDARGQQIGLGLSLVIPGNRENKRQWLVYADITGPAPSNAVMARIQFTKSAGDPNFSIQIDKVLFGRLI
ncbi:MAG: hypothetical protein PHF87_09560 [Desulfotomaculaceae bacterium]|nr:hypothetical protein [Desulfotomaculaceae bacterium]